MFVFLEAVYVVVSVVMCLLFDCKCKSFLIMCCISSAIICVISIETVTMCVISIVISCIVIVILCNGVPEDPVGGDLGLELVLIKQVAKY